MDEYITMADGTIVHDAYIVGLDPNSANIIWKGTHSFDEIYATFGDRNKTIKMIMHQYGDVQEFDGFTEPTFMQKGDYESVVTLAK